LENQAAKTLDRKNDFCRTTFRCDFKAIRCVDTCNV